MTCTRWRSPCPGIHKNDNGPPPPSRMIPKVDLNWPTWSPTVHIPNNLPDSFAAPHHNVTITWRISGSVTIFTKESWHWRTEMQENLAISSHLLIHPANWSFFKCNFKRSIGLLARQHFVHRTKPGTGPSHANPTWCELLSHTWKRITSFSHTFWACTWEKKYKKAMNSHHRRKNTKFQKFKIIDRLLEIEREPFQVSEKMTFSQHFYLLKNNDENLYTPMFPSIFGYIQRFRKQWPWYIGGPRMENTWTLGLWDPKRIQNEGHGWSWIILNHSSISKPLSWRKVTASAKPQWTVSCFQGCVYPV